MNAKNEVFFDEKGITSTSANHIANIAKEYVQQLQNENSAIRFLNCRVSLITSEDSKTVARGLTAEALNKIPGNLQKITEANALIAWFREAIKAKDIEMKVATELKFEDYLSDHKIESPIRPEKKNYGFVEFEDILATLSIKEREEYYRLETKCAVMGKFIHPEGGFSEARKELQKKITQPIDVKGAGQNAMIYEYSPSLDPKEVEDLFFSLQNEYRSAQATLNVIKFKIQQRVDEINQVENNKFSTDTSSFNDTNRKLQIDFHAYKEKKRTELSKLKIVIPNSLTGIFDILNNMGK